MKPSTTLSLRTALLALLSTAFGAAIPTNHNSRLNERQLATLSQAAPTLCATYTAMLNGTKPYRASEYEAMLTTLHAWEEYARDDDDDDDSQRHMCANIRLDEHKSPILVSTIDPRASDTADAEPESNLTLAKRQVVSSDTDVGEDLPQCVGPKCMGPTWDPSCREIPDEAYAAAKCGTLYEYRLCYDIKKWHKCPVNVMRGGAYV